MKAAGQTAGLARGPEVRSRRASVRNAIKAGDVGLCQILRGDRPNEETIALEMRVVDLVTAAVDSTSAMVRVLADAEIDGDARLGALTINARRQLADALGKETNR